MTVSSIAVISDVVCPWCYLGKRRLERALHELDLADKVKVEWFPYELNPDMPEEGIDRILYRQQKFGLERSAQFDAQLTQLGQDEGVPFAFERTLKTPNTRRAHMLIAYAGGLGRGDALVDGLFMAYFEEGRDIGTDEVLGDVAVKAGLDRDTALAATRDPGLRRFVTDLEGQAQQMGVQGVPFFIVDQAWAVSGAQPPAAWVQAIQEKIQETAPASS
jgi:predicted DsbA family dithiol-disulfide isomerase